MRTASGAAAARFFLRMSPKRFIARDTVAERAVGGKGEVGGGTWALGLVVTCERKT
jgi:hypothetical protein